MIGPDLEQFAEDLSAYVDDELSPQQRQAVEEKLRANAAARKLLEDLRATSQLVNSLPRHSAPPAVADDLNTQLERTELLSGLEEAETTIVTDRPGWFPKLSMAAMIAIVAVGGWWMMTDPASSPTVLSEDQFALAKTSTPTEENEARRAGARTESLPGSFDRLERDRSLHSADVETKLAAGIAPKALRNHAFANEPIRIQVPVRYQSEQASLLGKLTRRLASADAIDLAVKNTTNRSVAGAFFFRGRPGVNYNKGTTRQILVRATRSQLDKVLQEVQKARNASSVTLKAGSLTLKGSRKTREVLTMLFSPDRHGETSDADRSLAQKKLLDDVLVSLGVDPGAFRHPGDRSKSENQLALALDAADEFKEESEVTPTAHFDKYVDSLRSKRYRSTSKTATRKIQANEVATANKAMSVTAGATTTSNKKTAETYVTFIIEISIDKASTASQKESAQ